MKLRLAAACALGCIGIALGWTAACGSSSAPATGPTAVPATITALAISGTSALTAVGQTAQLVAEATYSDGSRKDISASVQWFTSNRNVATVSGGLVTAVGFGRVTISASSGGRGGTRVITILPEGTYILSGRVVEVGNLAIADARVELVGGAMSGQSVLTNQNGQFVFNGVSGVLQVRTTKDGYQPATQNVPQNTENMNIELAAAVPYASLGGVYRLVFTASSSCQLPDDAMTRTYTATIHQAGPGAVITVMLSDAQFWRSGQLTWNQFSGRVVGNLVTFTLWDQYYGFYYGGGVVEQLATNRFLSIVGTAQLRVPGPGAFSVVFPGSVSLSSNGNGNGRIATCSAADHRLAFTRVS